MSTKLQLLSVMTFMVAGLFTCTAAPKASNEMDTRPNVIVNFTECNASDDLLQEEIDDAYLLEEQSPTRRDIMVSETVQVWTMFYEDEMAPADDPRRQYFQEYAEYLADYILMYENAPTDIGGQLPISKDTHVLLATMITKESSVTADVVGKMGEVGLMQLHGVALAGYDPQVVRNNPKVGVMLGVRWFAYQASLCKPTRIPSDNDGWRLDDWLGPVSSYAGGPNAINKKTGKCYSFQLARDRVALTRLYKTRLVSESLN